MGLCVEREDVEDQPAAVDDLDVEQALERALLGRRQLVVGDEQVEAGLALGRDELLRLALADIPVRVDVATVLPFGPDHVGTGRGREVGELGERILGGPAVVGARVDGDQEGLLDRRGEIDHVSAHRRERIPARRENARSTRSAGCALIRQVSCALASAARSRARWEKWEAHRTMHRPIGVTLLAVGAGLAALFEIWRTLVFLGIANFTFIGKPVEFKDPQWGQAFWAILLAAIWIWIAEGFWNVRAYAWSFGIFISLFTIIFGFFALLGGAGTMESESVGWLLAIAIFFYLNYPGSASSSRRRRSRS